MATAMRAPRSPEKAMAFIFLLLLVFIAFLVSVSLTTVTEVHLTHGHLERGHLDRHAPNFPPTVRRLGRVPHRRHAAPPSTAFDHDEFHANDADGDGSVEHSEPAHRGEHAVAEQIKAHRLKHEGGETADRRHEGGDDGVDEGEGSDRGDHDGHDLDDGIDRGHGGGLLHFDHHDEIHADPVGDWIHRRWEDTKHLVHDVYDAGHHAVDAVEDFTGVHVFGHQDHEEGEGMSGGMGDAVDPIDDVDPGNVDPSVSARDNAKLLMASKTIAEVVADAGDNRKKAQAAVLNKLNGKVRVTRDKEPTPAYNYSSPPAIVPKQCREGAKISKSSVVNQKYIFHNSGGYAYSHMVMIGAMPPSSLWRWAMIWQASSSIEGAPGQHLLISFSDEPESSWTKPMMIPLQPSSLAVWGPVWHLDANGVIWLFYSQSTSCRKNAGRGRVKYAPGGDIKFIRSVDGISWTAPKTIITQASDQGIPKLVANQLQVHAETGNWVLPYWREQPHSKQCKPHADRTVRTSAGVLLSTNQGASWKAIGSWRARGIRWLIEGTVAEVGDKGKLLQLHRSGEPTLYKQTSDDGGINWSPATKTSIPNPNSKVNLIRMTNGDIALAFNDARGGVRRKLSVAVSSDGSTWRKLQQLEDSTPGLHYAYPTLAQDDCRLLVTYSVMRHGGRRQVYQSGIKLAVITVPTKKPPKVKVDEGEAEEKEEGTDAGISLDSPEEPEEDKVEEGSAEEEEKPIRGENEEGDSEEAISKSDEAAELAGGA